MVPCFLANPVLRSASNSPWLGLWPSRVSVPGLSDSDREYVGATLTLPVVPCFYNPAPEPQSQKESRRFILDRSVFDLVETHMYLSLTDSRLLNWYLSLSPEDRRIVQAEGGFRQFLCRHPALEMSKHHVYVKLNEEPSEYSDVNVSQTSSSSVGSENDPTEDRCQDYLLQRDQFTDEDQAKNIHSIMEDDQSILICSPSCLKSDPPQVTMNPSEFACRPTCDVSVGTELLLRTSIFTQTEDPETADKNVITEVHMSDLDYVAEVRPETQRLNLGDCDCTERAQKAELSLLALQYNICKHHIWRFFWEGKQLNSVNKDPPKNIAEVLDKLDSDYQEMKHQILAGVPLEQLKPLSVDSGKIISGSYTPLQTEKKIMKTRRAATVILKDGRFLQNNKQEGNETAAGEEVNRSELWFDAEEDLELPEEDLELPEEDLELPEEDLELPEEDLELPEVGQNPAAEPADVPEEGSLLWVSNLPSEVTKNDVMLLLKDYEASEVKIAVLKDDQRVAMVTVSGPQAAEAAVEDLDGRRLKDHTVHVEHIRGNENLQDPTRPGPSENLQDPTRPGPSENLQNPTRPGPSENLQNPTRPGPSENLQNPTRPGPSENLQNPTRPGPSENLQDPTRPGPSENLQDPTRPGPSENLQNPTRPGPSENLQNPTRPGPSENRPSSPGRTPLISSSRSRMVVFISPTARRTCVPQHYGTMGGFDTLMSELLQRHPAVGQQKIMDALVELRRKHAGVLTGLPLQTIREMTSQLLTRPQTASQI
ncbi:RNA-binding protein 44 [Acanthochromis polyacanthus]|uniref:RNA-binding protein 44 n=1 Tax=Acanthochromis polyacanthus TaxID=80966 RepID=UPI0022348329|nr:RNA-binding protein 44 [Acanthochromis polyacanthus]